MIDSPPCFYCGSDTFDVNKGEHVFPKNLGGVVTINNVCTNCNNTVISRLDEELRTRSALTPVAAEELGTKIGLSWDVVKSQNNMLLEAHPLRIDGKMRVWPQLVLEGDQLQQWGDEEDEERAGPGVLGRMLVRLIKNAYEKWNYVGHSREFTLENLAEQKDLMEGYRYPSRVYLRERIWEFSKKSHFRLSYVSEYDKRRMLLELSKLDRDKTFYTREKLLCSFKPLIGREWYPRTTARGLVKIALNLMCKSLGGDFVNYRTFPEAINFVLYDRLMEPAYSRLIGFLKPADLHSMSHPSKGHCARLLNYNGYWVCLISFFGGRICSSAAFPGPFHENVRTMNISTPLQAIDRDVTSEWEEIPSIILQEIPFQVVEDPKLMNPAIPLNNVTMGWFPRPRSKNPMKRQ